MKWIRPGKGPRRGYELYQRAAEIFKAEGSSAARAAILLKETGLCAVCDVFNVNGVIVDSWPAMLERDMHHLALRRLTAAQRRILLEPLKPFPSCRLTNRARLCRVRRRTSSPRRE